MTEEYALQYIKHRMLELGHGDNYFATASRHYSLYAFETRVLNAYNEYFFLIEADVNVMVSSEFGDYDLSDSTINEQLYEHQGKITLTNKSHSLQHIKFIQVIPKYI
jgi:hypothetical protein